ncbi:MAG: prepilin-type N-terminal cleavage/methylation domain-containing protein [Gemmatimonadaceae bacterium]
MLKNRAGRSGFTLPEVLVTVAIVAVLAAAVVPTVVNQIGKGDAASVSAEINSLTGAVTQFVTDTRRYPDQLAHLNTLILSGDDDLLGTDYGTRAVAGWKGPYLATTQDMATDDFTFSSFGLVADNVLIAPAAGNGHHITLNLGATTTMSLATLIAIDQGIDAGDGVFDPDCAIPAISASSTSGRLTWTEAAGTPCVITNIIYRLVPVGS